MSSKRLSKILTPIGFVVLLILSNSAFSQSDLQVERLDQQINEALIEIEDLKGEIGYTESRLQQTRKKFNSYQQDLHLKNVQLINLQEKYKADPSPENEQFIRNEEQRIQLVELSMNSRINSIERLESKQSELRDTLASKESNLVELKASLLEAEQLAIEKQKNTEKQIALDQKNEALKALQRENERLRQLALVKAEQLKAQETKKANAKELVEADEVALKKSTSPVVSGSVASKNNSENLLPAGAKNKALAGGNEANIDATNIDIADAKDANTASAAEAVAMAEIQRLNEVLLSERVGSSSGDDIYLKSNNGEDSIEFEYLGADQYRVDVVVDAPVTLFRIDGKTYRVSVTEADVGKEFVFIYDLSKRSFPRFAAFQKEFLEDSAAVAAD